MRTTTILAIATMLFGCNDARDAMRNDAGHDAGRPKPVIACGLATCGSGRVCCATALEYACSSVAECPSRNGTCPTTITIPNSCTDTTRVCSTLAVPQCDGSLVQLDPSQDPEHSQLTVVMFSAGWCTACRDLAPSLHDIETQYGARGVRFLEILDKDNDYNPANEAFCEEWTSQYRLTRPSLIDPCATALSLLEGGMGGVVSLPAVVVYDSTGTIVYRTQAATADGLRTTLDGLLGG